METRDYTLVINHRTHVPPIRISILSKAFQVMEVSNDDPHKEQDKEPPRRMAEEGFVLANDQYCE